MATTGNWTLLWVSGNVCVMVAKAARFPSGALVLSISYKNDPLAIKP